MKRLYVLIFLGLFAFAAGAIILSVTSDPAQACGVQDDCGGYGDYDDHWDDGCDWGCEPEPDDCGCHGDDGDKVDIDLDLDFEFDVDVDVTNNIDNSVTNNNDNRVVNRNDNSVDNSVNNSNNVDNSVNNSVDNSVTNNTTNNNTNTNSNNVTNTNSNNVTNNIDTNVTVNVDGETGGDVNVNVMNQATAMAVANANAASNAAAAARQRVSGRNLRNAVFGEEVRGAGGTVVQAPKPQISIGALNVVVQEEVQMSRAVRGVCLDAKGLEEAAYVAIDGREVNVAEGSGELMYCAAGDLLVATLAEVDPSTGSVDYGNGQVIECDGETSLHYGNGGRLACAPSRHAYATGSATRTSARYAEVLLHRRTSGYREERLRYSGATTYSGGVGY